MPRRSNRGTSDTVFLQNAVKTLVANIRFASVDSPVKTLVVTSSIPNEGKSTISIELARALAAGGKDVLIVEGDLRRRTLAGVLGAHPRNGIYSVLSGQAALDEAVVAVGGKSSLWFLDAEPHIPNPVDIFSSRRFHRFVDSLRRTYDYVIFDTPPLSTFVDAAVLGSVADGTLLVVREDFVKREDLISSYDQLRKAEANVIGAVLNYCDTKRGDYYYSYYDQGSAQAGEKGGERVGLVGIVSPRAGEDGRELGGERDIVPRDLAHHLVARGAQLGASVAVEDVALCRVEVAAAHEGLLHEVLDLLDARSVLEASLHVSEDRRKLLARGDGAPVRKGPGHGRDDLLAVIALHASVPLHYVHGVSRLSLWHLPSCGR